MMRNSVIIGLTGGSGAGKSEAAKIFATVGAEIIDADRIGHEVILKGASAAYDEVLAEFGTHILSLSGEIDRKSLGAIVFADADKLARLSEIVHKYIIERIFGIIAATESRLIIIDAAVLIQAGIHKICDKVLGIFAPLDARIARICARDGLERADALARIRSQMSDGELAQYVDARIDNDGNFEEFQTRIMDFIADIFGGLWTGN
ncbi:MAG: dephospho-CoA kinase [Clostridiales bacterium]|jgi:dephospho-CoA kinase|nr:dephospho-CoA kinase [Clostridiales bacterium]